MFWRFGPFHGLSNHGTLQKLEKLLLYSAVCPLGFSVVSRWIISKCSFHSIFVCIHLFRLTEYVIFYVVPSSSFQLKRFGRIYEALEKLLPNKDSVLARTNTLCGFQVQIIIQYTSVESHTCLGFTGRER